MVVVTVETDCHLAPEMVVVTVVTDCRQCLERLVSKVVDLGWVDKHLKQVACPSSSHSNNKQMCHRTYRDLRARQTWMQVVKVSGAGMSTRKHARNARTRTSMVLCAMDSQQQTFMQQNSQACVPSFGCASMPGGPRSGSFPNLGVNPMSCQGNMPSGPVGASLEV